ncbi:MAG: hypothetical protein K2N95_02635 [Lachnospiraceae bacterium]|nr:hypothetical protein [Lachnospiraceae bacterium]
MGSLLKVEFSRAFRSLGFAVAIGVGIVICCWHFWENIYPLRNCVYVGPYPLSAFGKWIGGENTSLQGVLYYMMVPILCALPYAESYFFDLKSGYINQITMRCGKKQYVRAKYIVTFVSGAVTAICPLLFDFLLTGMVLPAVVPQRGFGVFPIDADMLMAELYYSKPFIYHLMYFILDAVFLGLLNIIALIAVHFTENRFLVMLMPFLVYLFVFSVCQMLGVGQFCPAGYLRPSQMFISSWYIIAGELLLLLASGGVFLYVDTKKEDI